jgi:hypothetical protein
MMRAMTKIDSIGTRVFFRPMLNVRNLNWLNFLDDLGIFFVCEPLRYLHRFAAFLLDVDLDADSSAADI